MSLLNCIVIVVGIHKLGHEDNWTKVFKSLELEMPSNMRTYVSNLDKAKGRKRKYIAKEETKVKQLQKKIKNVKNLMKKQEIDAVCGATYGS